MAPFNVMVESEGLSAQAVILILVLLNEIICLRIEIGIGPARSAGGRILLRLNRSLKIKSYTL